MTSTEPREKAVPKYFLKTPPAPKPDNFKQTIIIGCIILLLGLIGLVTDIDCIKWPGLVLGLLVIGWAFIDRSADRDIRKKYDAELADKYEPKPSDQQMDAWLQGDVQRIREDSLRKLDLLPKKAQTAATGNDGKQLPAPRYQAKDPTANIGDIILVNPAEVLSQQTPASGDAPILAPKEAPTPYLKYLVVKGPDRDAALAVGADGVVRYSKYRVLVMYLTDYHMASYQCSLDMAKGAEAISSESTQEYHYTDVVSVSTQTDSTEFTVLVNGKKTVLPNYQKFAMAVSSGDRTEMAVSFPQLKDQIKDMEIGDIKHTTDIDDAVSVIRARLREKKGGLSA